MKSRRLLAVLGVAVAFGCADVTEPELSPDGPLAKNGATRADVEFTLTVNGFGSEFIIKEMGRSGRGFVRNYSVYADVTGDVTGTAEMVLNANYDAPSWWMTGPGVAPTWGTLAITTGAGTWTGNLVGEFVFDPALHPWNAQLFSKVNLHGPDGAKLKAVCDETTPESEVVVCNGEVLNPGG